MCQIDVLYGKSLIIDFLDDFLKKRTAIRYIPNIISYYFFQLVANFSQENAAAAANATSTLVQLQTKFVSSSSSPKCKTSQPIYKIHRQLIDLCRSRKIAVLHIKK